jgi:hypothetical protein
MWEAWALQKDCPQRYNIQFMTMEEKDEWRNKKALQRDAEKIAEMEKEEDAKGFLKCSE